MQQEPQNAHSHLLSIMIGNTSTIPITGGKLALGTWQVRGTLCYRMGTAHAVMQAAQAMRLGLGSPARASVYPMHARPRGGESLGRECIMTHWRCPYLPQPAPRSQSLLSCCPAARSGLQSVLLVELDGPRPLAFRWWTSSGR